MKFCLTACLIIFFSLWSPIPTLASQLENRLQQYPNWQIQPSLHQSEVERGFRQTISCYDE